MPNVILMFYLRSRVMLRKNNSRSVKYIYSDSFLTTISRIKITKMKFGQGSQNLESVLHEIHDITTNNIGSLCVQKEYRYNFVLKG
jgi:hypothetical protein